MYESLEHLVLEAAESVRPPERLTVSQASERYIRINNPGSYTGPWRNDVAPYLVEPMDLFGSNDFTGVVIVAPAQSGKTAIGLNWAAYTVICDPMNFMIVEKTQTTARDFSRMRFDKMIFDCPEVDDRLVRGSGDNVHDKKFKSGAMVLLSWPTVNNLSGKPMPRMFLTDYDRMDQDVGGEGAPYDLSRARITTFGHYGMAVAESSPSYPINDPRWTPATPHEAPPCEGILGLYNRGDRRRWFWRCVVCLHAFEPSFKLLRWPDVGSHSERGEQAWLECPNCKSSYYHEPHRDMPGKHAMNLNGFWLADGQRMLENGEIVGTPIRTQIASFWLKGVAAAFKDWHTIVFNYLNALHRYNQTGFEEDLKTTINVDQGEPYLPKSLESERLPEQLKDRARDIGNKEVPEPVRFLVASVDVQKTRFVVQVHGISYGGDIWVIDRFDVRYSLREDPDRPGQYLRVRPHAEVRDWRVLLSEVILRTYPLADQSGRNMAIKSTICDSGGLQAATSNCYQFWRWLRHGPRYDDPDYRTWIGLWSPGMAGRFALYRGGANTEGRIKLTFPDSTRSKFVGAGGQIPVLRCNPNLLKDQVDSLLDRESIGTGRITFPHWLPLSFYKELCAETRDLEGRWVNPKQFRNESWDLLVMLLAVLVAPQYIGIEVLNWERPPIWASPWDDNPMVSLPEGPNPIVIPKRNEGKKTLAELAKRLA